MSEPDRDALLTALAPIIAALRTVARGESPRPGSASIDPDSGLGAIATAFSLTSFERDLLALCAGYEIDPIIAGLCAQAGGPEGRPAFGLGLSVLAHPHWSAFGPTAPLRRYRLVELGAGPLMNAPVLLAERVLHYVMGVEEADPRLLGLLAPAPQVPPVLGDDQERIANQINAYVRAVRGRQGWPLVVLAGGHPATRRQIAAAAANRLGVGLDLIDGDNLPASRPDQESLRGLIERESILRSRALLFEYTTDSGGGDQARLHCLDSIECIALVSAQASPHFERPALNVEVPRLTMAQRRAIWNRVLGLSAPRDGVLDAIAAQFEFGEPEIAAAAAQLEATGGADPDAVATQLWEASRVQGRPRVDELATRVRPAASWDDLVLPESQLETLREIAAQVRQRARVYETWGFARKSSRGLGIAVLFAGPSGTGKTMAAEVLATELALDLFRIDLSAVVSKYIGETEKNLRRVFDAAEGGGAILLFDEADALFGKRTEVRDSHDRFANIEISYLLQRMEAYRGLAILTTNMERAIDTAFLRRIRFTVQFPFPNPAEREQIWKRIFPPSVPLEGVDPAALARLDLAGGSIRNVALSAAFLAADAGEPVSARHLQRAARAEYVKLGRQPTRRSVVA